MRKKRRKRRAGRGEGGRPGEEEKGERKKFLDISKKIV